jgi:4-amino-4-deoxy-L-arabinose transferase-like glycosyltransferase
MKRIYGLFFVLILVTASFLRLYKLDKIPPSLNWDETAAAYNAYTIRNWAKDEWGKTLPLVFSSFRDDKRPVHIYITSMFFNIFGANDFTARFPSALLGILMVPLFFLFGRLYFGSDIAGLFSSFAIALSTYDVFYSRGLWEAHFSLFFFVLGLVLYKAAINGRSVFYPFAYFSFGLSMLSYHSGLVVVPLLVFLISLLYLKESTRYLIDFSLGIFIFLIFISLLFWEPRLLGTARMEQNKSNMENIEKTRSFRLTKNQWLGQLEYSLFNNNYYPSYFSLDYLLKNGSSAPRSGFQNTGLFSPLVIFLSLLGIVGIILRRRYIRVLLILFFWFFISPLPAVFTLSQSHTTRAIFMLGPPEILAGFGFYFLLSFLKNRYLKFFFSAIIVFILLFDSFPKFVNFFNNYSRNTAIEWQYGMKEIVEFVNSNPKYEKVYMDNIRQQPYIFFLWYGKVPLPEFLSTVKYDESLDKSFNTVFSFGKFQFGNWDWVNSYPEPNVLYIVEPYKYTGLRFRDDFDVVHLVRYPYGGRDAFFLVSGF